MNPIRVTVDATYDLTAQVGDSVRAGEAVCRAENAEKTTTWPTSGRIESIEFDAQNHEFIITIRPA